MIRGYFVIGLAIRASFCPIRSMWTSLSMRLKVFITNFIIAISKGTPQLNPCENLAHNTDWLNDIMRGFEFGTTVRAMQRSAIFYQIIYTGFTKMVIAWTKSNRIFYQVDTNRTSKVNKCLFFRAYNNCIPEDLAGIKCETMHDPKVLHFFRIFV